MKLLALLATLAIGAAQPAIPPNASPGSTYTSDAWPPERFQKDNAAVVLFVSDVEPYCGHVDPPLHIIACSTFKDGTPIIVLPNPNLAPKDDVYARIAAHELAHISGWPAWHGQ
jgi:hypothetical protein